MNKHHNEQHKVGDLVTIQDTSYFGMVVDKRPEYRDDAALDFMYKIHFCGEEEPDNRWLFEDALERI